MKDLITNFNKFEEELSIDASNVSGDYSPGEGHRMSQQTKEETLKLKIKNLKPSEVQVIITELQPQVKTSTEDSRQWLLRFFLSQLKQNKTELINKYFSDTINTLNG